MLQRWVRAFLLLAGWLASAAPGWAYSILPGQALEVPFSLTAPAPGADTLVFKLVNVVGVAVSGLTIELYDGATLLGSVSGVPANNNNVAAFTGAGSAWVTNAAVVDLSSVADGTIVGRIRVLPDFAGGASVLNAEVSSFTSFAVGHSANDLAVTPIAGAVSMGVASVVPEPAAALLLGASAALLRLRRRSR